MALPPALPSDRPSDDTWSELEHGFFASAPPDVPEPPAEPMRFDDLEPIDPPPASPWQARVSRAWLATAAARRTVRVAAHEAYRRGAPVVARAWRRGRPVVVDAWQRGGPVVARAWQRTIQLAATALRRSAPALAALRIGARNHRFIAAGALALVMVMGISAVVVASRGGGPVATAGAPLLAGAACPMASSEEEAPPVPVEMSASESALAEPADTMAPDPVKPRVRHKRKHAKAPAHRAALAKPAKLHGEAAPRSTRSR